MSEESSSATAQEKPKYNFAVLKLYVNSENVDLVQCYKDHIDNHNQDVKTNPFPNSGFDLIVPDDVTFDQPMASLLINMEVKAEMVFFDSNKNSVESCAYYMFPRSSLSKTPLMLSNHTGIIDSGYRGYLMGAFRCLYFPQNSGNTYVVKKQTRLLQICHSSLCPIYVQLVDESLLSSTARGDGGFGSTGIVGAVNV